MSRILECGGLTPLFIRRNSTESAVKPAHSKLSFTLRPRHLLHNPTKLFEPKFFSRSQQRPLGVDDPIVTLPKRCLSLVSAAAKQLAQQTFRADTIDRLANGLG